jgi:5-methylcytosine-specific restriction endonuclease McrA
MGRVRQTRAEYLRGYNKAGRQQRRGKLVEMLDGCCARCGATEDLEFDHIDPATKRFAVGSSMSRAWDELVEEAPEVPNALSLLSSGEGRRGPA